MQFFLRVQFSYFLKCVHVNIRFCSTSCCLSRSTDSLWKTPAWQLHSMLTDSPDHLCVVLLALDSLSHLCRNSPLQVQQGCARWVWSWTDKQMFLNICSMPSFTVGLVTLLRTRGLNLFVNPSVMAATLEEAPISNRAFKSYQNAKIKEFGNILSNPDRFCNQKQQNVSWISDLDVSPLLEKSK